VDAPATLTALDVRDSFVVEPARFAGKGRATPFAGRTLTGRVAATWIMGQRV
jgi:dihydroorotase-like cyclic amidohydrolase